MTFFWGGTHMSALKAALWVLGNLCSDRDRTPDSGMQSIRHNPLNYLSRLPFTLVPFLHLGIEIGKLPRGVQKIHTIPSQLLVQYLGPVMRRCSIPVVLWRPWDTGIKSGSGPILNPMNLILRPYTKSYEPDPLVFTFMIYFLWYQKRYTTTMMFVLMRLPLISKFSLYSMLFFVGNSRKLILYCLPLIYLLNEAFTPDHYS